MVSEIAIIAAMQRQPICWADRERPEEHSAYIQKVSSAISKIAKDEEEAAALVAIGYSETRWCEHPRKNPGRGPWQVERGANAPHFADGDIDGAAHAAAVMWRRSWQCGGSYAQRFTAYAGRPCYQSKPYLVNEDFVVDGWPSLNERVSRFWSAFSTIRKNNVRTKTGAAPSRAAFSEEKLNATG